MHAHEKPALRLLAITHVLTTSVVLAACAVADSPGRVSPPPTVASTKTTDSEVVDRLRRIDEAIENKRRELNVPGIALAIVKDGQVIHRRGFGYRDLEKGLPVTPQTVFAIGSVTKQFTSFATLLAVDDGKISLQDSPKKCLPYFRLADPEADAAITVRDLLIHSSGLGRTDQSWIYGRLTREEAIRIAGGAKALVKLGEAWNYQNTMYTAAGECVARVEGTTYEDFVAARIFAPLEMGATSAKLEGLSGAEDRAVGYEVSHGDDGAVEGVVAASLMDLSAIAPAGSINSNVDDMAKWLVFLLEGGKQPALVSEASWAEFQRPQMRISNKSQYALGWFVEDWRNHTHVHHGGNVTGFTAMVGMLPKERIGFVMLTNLEATPLAATVEEAVFSLALKKTVADAILAKTDPGRTEAAVGTEDVPPELEVGTYEFHTTPEDVVHAAVVGAGGRLKLLIPGQPEYELVKVTGRRYRFTPPESERDFFVTFRRNGKNGQAEAYLEQPGAKVVLKKLADDPGTGLKAVAVPAQDTKSMTPLLGIYEAPKQRLPFAPSVRIQDETVVLAGVGGTRGLALVPTETADRYGLHGAPRLVVTFQRDGGGTVTGFQLDVRGQQQIDFVRTRELPPELPAPKMTAEQLMEKVRKAHGGAAMKKHHTMVLEAATTRPFEGMDVEVTIKRAAPNKLVRHDRYSAFGKTIMQSSSYFDGVLGVVDPGRYEARKVRGRSLQDLRIEAAFDPLGSWKTLFSSVKILRTSEIEGRTVYVIEKRNDKGSVITDYISADTFRIVKRERRSPGSSAVSEELFDDYRKVSGVWVPHRIRSGAGAERAETRVKRVQFDSALSDADFRPDRPVTDRKPLQVVLPSDGAN